MRISNFTLSAVCRLLAWVFGAAQSGGLAKATEQVNVADTPATLVEAIGAANGSLSVFHPAGGQTWFYKMSGPSNVVTAEKGAFMEFLQSIQFPKP